MLCREYLHLKGDLSRDSEWNVMVDLFMYRDFDAKKDKTAEEGEGEAEGEEEGAADDEGQEVVKESMKKFSNENEDEEDEESEGEEGATWKNKNAGSPSKQYA